MKKVTVLAINATLPDPQENVYSEWNEEHQIHGVFGSSSGHCYSIHPSEEAATKAAERLARKRGFEKSRN